jgi:hypothetical protein
MRTRSTWGLAEDKGPMRCSLSISWTLGMDGVALGKVDDG